MRRNRGIDIIAIVVALTIISVRARAEESSESEFSWFSLAPEIGYLRFFKTTIDEKYNVKLPARDGFVVKGHVDIGGDGIAVEFAPLFAWESAGELFGNFKVLGGEVTLALRAEFGSFYPGIGIGFHGAGIFGNECVKSGTELFARVPIGFTWYFSDILGLVFEIGVMYGGTGIRVKEVVNPSSGDENKLNILADGGDMYWGGGFGFDVMIGLRFP